MSRSNFYTILGVTPRASPEDLRHAYRRALMQLHPDKAGKGKSADMDTLRMAYLTLTSPELRAEHDEMLAMASNTVIEGTKGRPAEVVSLDDLVPNDNGEWIHPCRCGSQYRISGNQLEQGTHLISCEGCSEVIYVGYEVIAD